MRNRFCFLILLFFLVANMAANAADEKWGISASVTPWIENREFTISRQLSKSWTVLFWGDFTFDKNKVPGNDEFNIDKGYKWLIGPEFRKKIYYSEEYRIAPYFGVLLNGGYEEYEMTARYYRQYKKSHHTIEGGVEFTFGVEYFFKDYISINIHSRFLKYHYYWIDLDTFYPDKKTYKTGYHVLNGFETLPAVYIRFYF